MTFSEKPKKRFDCMDFKRQAQARIYEKIKDMTPVEEIEFFRRQAQTGPFAYLLRNLNSPRRADSQDSEETDSVPDKEVT